MERVEEIEAAIDNLAPEDFCRIADWFRERDHLLWDQQLDSDSASGRLNFLFEEVEADSRENLVRDWPTRREVGASRRLANIPSTTTW